MDTLYKLKIIFAYYVQNEYDDLYKYHLVNFNSMLELNCENDYFNDINFYLLIDDINNEELINKTRNYILSYINTKYVINFHIVQNNPIYREGLIYKTEIIDKLDQYDKDQLILFMHTKGVTNGVNRKYYENTKNWITAMHYYNLIDVNMVFEKFYKENIITYGTLYNYDESSLVKYKWQYTGSFHWIYPYRFLQYIKNKNIDYNDIKNRYKSNMFIKVCAEAFVGDNIETDYAGFLDDDLFNKKCSHFLHEPSTLPYENILYVLSDLSYVDHHNDFLSYLNSLKNNLG